MEDPNNQGDQGGDSGAGAGTGATITQQSGSGGASNTSGEGAPALTAAQKGQATKAAKAIVKAVNSAPTEPEAEPVEPTDYEDIAATDEIVAEVGPRMGGPRFDKVVDPARKVIMTKTGYELFDREKKGKGKLGEGVHCKIKLLGIPDYDLKGAKADEKAQGFKVIPVFGDFEPEE